MSHTTVPQNLTPSSDFIHINSTGNTFIVNTQALLKGVRLKDAPQYSKKKIQQICAQYKVDGFAILGVHNIHNLQWQFFNADGGPSHMCGNLARGLIYYLSTLHNQTRFSILGPNNIIQTGDLRNQSTFLSMPQGESLIRPSPSGLEGIYSQNFLNNKENHCKTIAYIKTGVPHALIPIYPKELNLPQNFSNFFSKKITQNNNSQTHYTIQSLDRSLQTLINQLRRKNTEGFNVSLFNPNNLQAISFERGVESFTLSCGTGACSIAYYLKNFTKQYSQAREIIVNMPGGQLPINTEKKDYLLGGKCQIINIDAI